MALLGATGAGKTTLLKILAGLVAPSEGSAQIFGIDVAAHPALVRRHLSFVVSDERSFYHRLTGLQNLLFFAALFDIERKAACGKAEELLDSMGLRAAADTMVKDYSSGMRQKLALCRGLLPDPEVLLLDEPSRSLDPLFRSRLRGLIRGRAARLGQSILLATHDLAEAEATADRIAILHEGHLKAVGTMAQLRQRCGLARHVAVRVAGEGAVPDCFVPTGVPSSSGERSFRIEAVTSDRLDEITTDLLSRGLRLRSLVQEEATLENLLSSLTGETSGEMP